MTGKSPPGPDRQDKTGHPTGTRSPPGLAWKLRLPLGMTRSQGPSQGPSATASSSATGGASGWHWPPWPQLEEPPAPDESPWTRQDMTRQGKLKCSCGHNKTQTRLSWP